jgi:hypothetical protein
MKKNGAEVVHFATGLIVGYPPCPYLFEFRNLIRQKYGMEVVLGTHPIPQTYYEAHTKFGTWDSPEWQEAIKPTLTDEPTRRAYT